MDWFKILINMRYSMYVWWYMVVAFKCGTKIFVFFQYNFNEMLTHVTELFFCATEIK